MKWLNEYQLEKRGGKRTHIRGLQWKLVKKTDIKEEDNEHTRIRKQDKKGTRIEKRNQISDGNMCKPQ